ncbi:MAG: TraM recognition domain-containing protein [Desulfovibrio sp.]|nr:TraM recognition domain-containing protein [Desulfovibrio sp.]
MNLSIGFTASRDIARAKPVQEVSDCDSLMKFDSERILSMVQGTRSVANVGGTGSGKTSGVMSPMVDHLIRAGYGGLILDVKGNMLSKILPIVAQHGRLDDVVEFGTSPTACRTDFLEGMAEHEVADLFSTLATCGIGKNSHNMNFFMNGSRIYYNVYRCLLDISRIHPDSDFSRQFRPTLAKVFHVVNNPRMAQGLWSFYTTSLRKALEDCEKKGVEPPDYLVKAEEFASVVQSDSHHVLREPGEETSSQYRDQLSYALNHINGVFSTIEATHGLLDRFSCRDEDAVAIDFDKIVFREHKIVIVHFAMDSGRAGEILSKAIKSRYYQSVIRNGYGSAGYTFMIGDEFQSIIDTSDESRLNDMDFFSISREYRNINIIATQSVASLRAKGGAEAVSSLLANCMTKIILQTSDPETDAWVRSMRGGAGASIRDLGRGECVIMCPDDEGRLIEAEDSVNSEYRRIQDVIKGYQSPKHEERGRPLPPWRVGTAGFPYAISRVLTTPFASGTCRGRLSSQDRRKYGQEMYAKLNKMREMSRAGKPFWKASAPRRGTKTSVSPRLEIGLRLKTKI